MRFLPLAVLHPIGRDGLCAGGCGNVARVCCESVVGSDHQGRCHNVALEELKEQVAAAQARLDDKIAEAAS